MPAAAIAAWSAAVPELTATACGAPAAVAAARSNSATRGPVVSHAESSTSLTARASASSTDCRP